MKTLWILAAAATFAACASKNEDDVGAAPDRGDTTATTQVDTATGTWDTTSTSGDVNAQPSDTAMAPTTPSDTAMTPTTPSDTSVGQYPTPSETQPDTSAVAAPDTGAYVPDSGSAGTDTSSTGGYDQPAAGDTSGVDSGMGTDSTAAPTDPSVPADPGASGDTTSATPQ